MKVSFEGSFYSHLREIYTKISTEACNFSQICVFLGKGCEFIVSST